MLPPDCMIEQADQYKQDRFNSVNTTEQNDYR